MQTVEALNRSLFLVINGTPTSPSWLIHIALAVANYAIWLVPVTLVGLWLTGNVRDREAALRAFVVTMLALGVNQLIGLVWTHPRPSAMGLGYTFLPHTPDSSFPSDHFTVLSALGVTLFAGGMWWRGYTIAIIGLAVAWARIYVGVHFPLDMIGALVVAGLSYAAIAPVWNAFGWDTTQWVVSLYRKLLAKPIVLGWLRA
ncbi:phosphatase PAP2 family protein [Paraburkholderia phosphatilytica]|uniref:phosphatase PAP2 family protein n=1 Tax=Paraburkholderia phosphatilytica TaxID=2282883 RepID=UPI000E4E34B5|nr:phosphatase PAP2 family protein [Paraburkholderia phosphatilytica]